MTRRRIASLWGWALAAILASTLLFSVSPSEAKEIHVHEGDNPPPDIYSYPSVLQAFVMSASSGDEIILHPGTYDGPIMIYSNITVRSSDGPGVTRIRGDEHCARWYGYVVKFGEGSLGKISGLTIDANSVYDDGLKGIYITDGSAQIVGCEINYTEGTRGDGAIVGENVGSLHLSENKINIVNGCHSVDISGVGPFMLRDNSFKGPSSGVGRGPEWCVLINSKMEQAEIQILRNTFVGRYGSGVLRVNMDGQSSCEVSMNIIKNTMREWGYGVLLDDNAGNSALRVTRNTVEANSKGIDVVSERGKIEIIGNSVASQFGPAPDTWGIRILGAANNAIVRSDTVAGFDICIMATGNPEISNCVLRGCRREVLTGDDLVKDRVSRTPRVAAPKEPVEAAAYKFVKKWNVFPTARSQGSTPTDGHLALDALGNVYVANDTYDPIEKYASDGQPMGEWAATWGIWGIAADPSGNVYVGNIGTGDAAYYKRIQKFTSAGVLITEWELGGAQGDGYYSGLAVGGSGNVYLGFCGDNHARIEKFTPTGVSLCKWETRAGGDDLSWRPYALAVDGSENIYVLGSNDYGDDTRIQKFTSAGVLLDRWPVDQGSAIAIDAWGNMYVTGGSSVKKYGSGGTLIASWGRYGQEVGQFIGAGGIAVDQSGGVYVLDTGNSRIQVFAPSHQ